MSQMPDWQASLLVQKPVWIRATHCPLALQ
jgi:hypothetical protein